MIKNSALKTDLISAFIDDSVIEAMDDLLGNDEKTACKAAAKVSEAFGTGADFAELAAGNGESDAKLISSFQKNVMLLAQKTWVEASDAGFKDTVLAQLEDFCAAVTKGQWAAQYGNFLTILQNMVYLMYGKEAKNPDFGEYALRIDPEFGIFWWYVSNLPKDAQWSDAQCRIAVLLGMFFLANY